jgi:hypothetical protein
MECKAKQQSTKRWSGKLEWNGPWSRIKLQEFKDANSRNNGNNHPNDGIEWQQRHPTATKNGKCNEWHESA